jgi:hypothetical protein
VIALVAVRKSSVISSGPQVKVAVLRLLPVALLSVVLGSLVLLLVEQVSLALVLPLVLAAPIGCLIKARLSTSSLSPVCVV